MTGSTMTMFDFDAESVRATLIDGEPWFVGRDVCRALSLENTAQALSRLRDNERNDTLTTNDAIGRERAATLISEPGVYRLVFTSRSDAAERFKDWLCYEVLPALRKTGQYNMSEHVGRTTRMERDDDPIDLDAAPLGQIRIAVSLLREVRIIFGIAKARKVARRIPALAEIVGEDAPRGADDTIEADDVETFAGDMLIEASQSAMTAAEIWKAYRDWCRNNETEPVSQTMLGRRLGLMGFKKKQSNGKVRYVGVALFVPEPDPEKKD